nr:hypothetical protein [uncultured bacterium]
MTDDRTTQTDRMRYTKNTASSRLALLAIVFDVLFFISIYKSDVGTYYYTIVIGASIVYNLVFMLAVFLCSEGVKNYKAAFSWVMLAIGIGQIVRIFIIPADAHGTEISGVLVMGNGQFIRTVFYLAASALCLFAGAVINLRKSKALADYTASLQM